ncbi:S8/S53 family peptidase [Micromonospora olivasterospora]|uniref:Subtilase family protein n=1 Tax=Micromonospora olivasterospora TaxID=1880 RepID=A0A562IFV5_MICOL|nr:S8/S53 family peptidase [Micromonospora olivasterospora]TWH69708.1 subtilase family protein [Micromonospora olivasterospora]
MPPDHPNPPRPAGGLSRRRLLAASALAAAAVPLGAGTRPVPALADGADDLAYQRVFDEALAADKNVRRYTTPGREFLYRPRQLLAANADVQRVVAWLRARGYVVTVGAGFAGVTRLLFDRETDVPGVVARLRDPQQWPGQSVPKVQPHHVLLGLGNIMGNPGSPPQAAAALPPPDSGRLGEGAGVTVGICDTGIWQQAGGFHPLWLGGAYVPQADDEDPLYVHTDVLAPQGGHGTFVAGVVRQAAPGVRVDPEQALNATGVGDEASVVAAMGRLVPEVSIINLSLGGFTQDDQPSLPLANAVAALPATSAVVAAAGNAGTGRPIWPAALSRVVGVAAVTQASGGLVPAAYSGFGAWVDACAIGERDSTYVEGQLPLPGLPTRVFHGFAAWAGTSFATAYVSGRLAAMMTAGGLSADAARLALLAAPRWHPDYGALVP